MTSCDSGSPAIFKFKGVASIINKIKQNIIFIYERIAFPQDTMNRLAIENLSQSLPLMVDINKKTSEGKISPEEAAQLKRILMRGYENYISSASTIPEIKQISLRDPDAALLKGRTLLLEGPPKSTQQSKGMDSTKKRQPTSSSSAASRKRKNP
jgi:hypothetical protein